MRQMFVPYGLRQRLFLIIMLIFVPALLFLCMDAAKEYREAERAVVRDTQRFAALIADDIQQLLTNTQMFFSSVAWVYRQWPETADDPALHALLTQFVRENQHLVHLQIADQDGRILVSAGRGPVSAADPELVREAIERSQLGIGRFDVDFVGTQDVLHLAHYVRALPEADNFLVLGSLDFQWFEALLADEEGSGRVNLFPEHMVVCALAHDGTVLSRRPHSERWMGQLFSDTPLHRAILAGVDSTAEVSGVDGVTRIYSFHPVKGSSRELFVCVGVPRAVAFKGAQSDFRKALLVLLGVGLALLVAAWFGTDVLVLRPIHALSFAAGEISRARLDARAEVVGGPSEVADLAASFNAMAAALQSHDRQRSGHLSQLVEYEKQLRALALAASLAEEEERHRIAEGLHDQLGPLLASCYMRLDKALNKPAAENTKVILRQTRELIDQAIQDVQSLTFELSSPILHTLGIREALFRLCMDYESRYGMTFAFSYEGPDADIDADLNVLIFRTAKELLVNAAKHSNAQRVSTLLSVGADHVRLAVEDDGCGFDSREAGRQFTRTGGFGLFTIRERTTALGGRMTIRSTIGQGTSVVVDVPCNRKNGETGDNEQNTNC